MITSCETTLPPPPKSSPPCSAYAVHRAMLGVSRLVNDHVQDLGEYCVVLAEAHTLSSYLGQASFSASSAEKATMLTPPLSLGLSTLCIAAGTCSPIHSVLTCGGVDGAISYDSRKAWYSSLYTSMTCRGYSIILYTVSCTRQIVRSVCFIIYNTINIFIVYYHILPRLHTYMYVDVVRYGKTTM